MWNIRAQYPPQHCFQRVRAADWANFVGLDLAGNTSLAQIPWAQGPPGRPLAGHCANERREGTVCTGSRLELKYRATQCLQKTCPWSAGVATDFAFPDRRPPEIQSWLLVALQERPGVKLVSHASVGPTIYTAHPSFSVESKGGYWLLDILDGQKATNLRSGSEVSLDDDGQVLMKTSLQKARFPAVWMTFLLSRTLLLARS